MVIRVHGAIVVAKVSVCLRRDWRHIGVVLLIRGWLIILVRVWLVALIIILIVVGIIVKPLVRLIIKWLVLIGIGELVSPNDAQGNSDDQCHTRNSYDNKERYLWISSIPLIYNNIIRNGLFRHNDELFILGYQSIDIIR